VQAFEPGLRFKSRSMPSIDGDLPDCFCDPLRPGAAGPQREDCVLVRADMRIERAVLKDHQHLAVPRRQISGLLVEAESWLERPRQ